MKRAMCLSAVLAVFVVAAQGMSGNTIETARTGAEAGFQAAAVEVPVQVKGAQQALRCDARTGRGSPGHRDRCPYDQVAIGVYIQNGDVVLSCAEIRVECR